MEHSLQLVMLEPLPAACTSLCEIPEDVLGELNETVRSGQDGCPFVG
jgi:hypothetical protein